MLEKLDCLLAISGPPDDHHVFRLAQHCQDSISDNWMVFRN